MLKQIGSSTDKIISEAFPNYFFQITIYRQNVNENLSFKQNSRGAPYG